MCARSSGSNFYDIIAQDKPEQFRRTIYRFSPRGARRNLLDTLTVPTPLLSPGPRLHHHAAAIPCADE